PPPAPPLFVPPAPVFGPVIPTGPSGIQYVGFFKVVYDTDFPARMAELAARRLGSERDSGPRV
ncbi:MAG: hypothetical protein COV52_05350, partial [Gammaproteobacteria bacterium CG11_big_fil_rev_8_21_14_0_20_46_22]